VKGAGVDEQRHPGAGEATERTSVSRAQQCGLRDVSANLIYGNGAIQDRSQPMFQRMILSGAPQAWDNRAPLTVDEAARATGVEPAQRMSAIQHCGPVGTAYDWSDVKNFEFVANFRR
jgi:hypothetical protein